MNGIQLFEVFFISTVISYLLTPFMKILAERLGYLDHPKDNKIHAHAKPLLGGVAIFTAFFTAVATKSEMMLHQGVLPVLAGSLILIAIGLIDDKMGMMPNVKLLGQFLAAIVVVKSGLRVGFVNNYYMQVILTYIWIIGITNAFNLLDNMNGLSAGVAAISALFFGFISFMNAQPAVSALSFALAGGALGFLRYNFPKASIFMGDTGSLVIGYVLSVVAIMGSWNSYISFTSLMIPILVLGYPIFDTALVSIKRLLEGRSIFDGGKDHSSHRLSLLGLKRFKTVLIIYAICTMLGLSAVAVTKMHWAQGVAVCIIASAAMLALGVRLAMVNTKQFGRKKGSRDDEG